MDGQHTKKNVWFLMSYKTISQLNCMYTLLNTQILTFNNGQNSSI